jgi:hypothetical protein
LPDRETRRRRRVKEKIVLIDKDLLSETLEDRDRPADPWSRPDLPIFMPAASVMIRSMNVRRG